MKEMLKNVNKKSGAFANLFPQNHYQHRILGGSRPLVFV